MLQYEVCRGTKRRVSVKRACRTSCFTLPDTLTLSQPLTLAMLCMQTETEISIVDVLKHGLTLQTQQVRTQNKFSLTTNPKLWS